MESYAHTVKDPTETIVLLKEKADQLEEIVKLTFNQPLSRTAGELEKKDSIARSKNAKAVLDGRLTGAKLLVSAAYVYLDVIWRIDPKTHPVQHELERVQAYFEKLKAAQNESDDRRQINLPTQSIDVGAASRIVAAGIGAKRKHTRFDARNYDDEKHTKTHKLTTDPAQDLHETQLGSRGASHEEKAIESTTDPKETDAKGTLRSDASGYKYIHTDARKLKKKNKQKPRN